MEKILYIDEDSWLPELEYDEDTTLVVRNGATLYLMPRTFPIPEGYKVSHKEDY